MVNCAVTLTSVAHETGGSTPRKAIENNIAGERQHYHW